MKILMLTWEFPPLISGGLGMACYGICKALLNMGNEIFMGLPTEKKVYFHLKGPEDTDNLKPVFLDINERMSFESRGFSTVEEKMLCLGISSAPETYFNPLTASLFESRLQSIMGSGFIEKEEIINNLKISLMNDQQLFRKVKEYALRVKDYTRHIDFDIIHAHDWLTYPAAIFAKFDTCKSLVAHVHATEFDRCGGPGNEYIHKIEYAGLSLADKVVTVSNYTRDMIASRYMIDTSKIRVVHNAFHINGKRPKNSRISKKPVVLFLGRITLQKGPEYFLEAAKRVIEEIPDVRFIIAGTGDMMESLIHRAAYYRLSTNFLFAGFLSRAQVERILSSTDIFILPSVSEPFGIAPLEAMSYKAATIISRQSGVSEVIRNAYKINFWDIDKMSRAIIDLIKNPKKRKAMSRAGSKEVKKISWIKPASYIDKTYKEVA